jgi:DNA excision repair protein ERCC-1
LISKPLPIKAYENKSPEVIREKVESDYISRLNGAVTSVRGVNKVDAATLGTNFGSLASVMRASQVILTFKCFTLNFKS